MSTGQIDSVIGREPQIPPSAEFCNRAVIGSMAVYESMYAEALNHPEEFWGDLGANELHWFQPFGKVLSGMNPLPSGSSAARRMRPITASTRT